MNIDYRYPITIICLIGVAYLMGLGVGQLQAREQFRRGFEAGIREVAVPRQEERCLAFWFDGNRDALLKATRRFCKRNG